MPRLIATTRLLSISAKGRCPYRAQGRVRSGFGSTASGPSKKLQATFATLAAWLPALAAEVSGVLIATPRMTMKTGKKQRRNSVPGTIYLLHFAQPYYRTRHYLGWTEGGLEQRLDRHMVGNGARLVSVVTEAGIGMEVVRLWSGTRELERQLKNRKNSPKLCPTCSKAESRRPG